MKKNISNINKTQNENLVIKNFGIEWLHFDQQKINIKELEDQFNLYFSNFPWSKINKSSVGFDAGCGSGRWAYFIARKVKLIHCIEPSEAIINCKKLLKSYRNCIFHNTSIQNMYLRNNSMDFGYCLGVLHHTEDPKKNLNICVKKLKKGAPFLIYVYYSLDSKPFHYKFLWRISNIFRIIISNLPFFLKKNITFIIALTIYFPLSRFSYFVNFFGIDSKFLPLSNYKNKSFLTLKTDAYDRFTTKIEKRYSKDEVVQMMKLSGLNNIIVNDHQPFWTAIGYKI